MGFRAHPSCHSSLTMILSNSLQIKTSVPQGSTLGPLLFLVYINDVPLNLENSSPFLFADDSTLLTKGTDEIEITNSLKSKFKGDWLFFPLCCCPCSNILDDVMCVERRRHRCC